MANLAQLALNRVQSRLPVFPGATVREQLLSARAQTHAVLLQYVPDLKFDVSEARDVMSQVNVWVEQNREDLEEAMQSSEQSLPEWLTLNMGSSERVQQWVIANYTVAAAGLGPWESGKVDQLAADPASDVSQHWASGDAQMRLNTFGMLIKMKNDGELDYIFRGPAQGAQGFGAFPVWAIVVIAIGLAAVVTYLYLESRKLELNNKLMRDICERAQSEGDTETVAMCIKATRDLQASTPWKQVIEETGKVALILGGGYLLFRYAVPWALDRVAGREKRYA
jgi:hypothetical protein